MTKKKPEAKATPVAFKKFLKKVTKIARRKDFKDFEPKAMQSAIDDFEAAEKLLDEGKNAKAWKTFDRGFNTSNGRMARLFSLLEETYGPKA